MMASPNSTEVVHGGGENEEEPPQPPHSSIPPIDDDDDNNEEQDQSSQQNLLQPPAPTKDNTHVTNVKDEEESFIEPYGKTYKRSGSTFSFLQAEPVDPLLLLDEEQHDEEQHNEEEETGPMNISIAQPLASLVNSSDAHTPGGEGGTKWCCEGRPRTMYNLVVLLLICITIGSTTVAIIVSAKSRRKAPSSQPSLQPSLQPSVSEEPSSIPSFVPTALPTLVPSVCPAINKPSTQRHNNKNNEDDLRRLVEVLPSNHAKNKKDINQPLTVTTSIIENSRRLVYYLTDRMATNVVQLPNPNWPEDFKWSSNGIPSGYNCIKIHESSDSTWEDNYFCWKDGTKDPGMKWSSAGEISNMRCTRITESADGNTWLDNYLCLPNLSYLEFSWEGAGQTNGKTCIRWLERAVGSHWYDNYLCAEQGCPIIDDIPASHATPGNIQYDKQPLSNGLYYPAGTKATFQCPYNPSWYHSDNTTCQGPAGWDKDAENECTINHQDNKCFRLLPSSFDRCPSSMKLSKEDCRKAGLLLGGKLKNGSILNGSWGDVPFGCSIQLGSGHIHYNSILGRNNDGFQPVCNKGSFMLLPKTNKGGCPSSMDISREEDCAAAGLSAGGKLRKEILIFGTWVYAPFGCFLNQDGEIHFNINSESENDGNYNSLCYN